MTSFAYVFAIFSACLFYFFTGLTLVVGYKDFSAITSVSFYLLWVATTLSAFVIITSENTDAGVFIFFVSSQLATIYNCFFTTRVSLLQALKEKENGELRALLNLTSVKFIAGASAIFMVALVPVWMTVDNYLPLMYTLSFFTLLSSGVTEVSLLVVLFDHGASLVILSNLIFKVAMDAIFLILVTVQMSRSAEETDPLIQLLTVYTTFMAYWLICLVIVDFVVRRSKIGKLHMRFVNKEDPDQESDEQRPILDSNV